jgi:hypothetical protein
MASFRRSAAWVADLRRFRPRFARRYDAAAKDGKMPGNEGGDDFRSLG